MISNTVLFSIYNRVKYADKFGWFISWSINLFLKTIGWISCLKIRKVLKFSTLINTLKKIRYSITKYCELCFCCNAFQKINYLNKRNYCCSINKRPIKRPSHSKRRLSLILLGDINIIRDTKSMQIKYSF